MYAATGIGLGVATDARRASMHATSCMVRAV
jgi:hypothetical protein